jgi:DNA helicase-2/ATP-dependent DNA helicase PcrA
MTFKPYPLNRTPAEAAPPSFRIAYHEELNPAQFKAATAEEGPVLVIAGAGSGKTRTLVYRLAYLIEKGIPPSSVLLLTFTRKAAQEMLRRAALLIGASCERVTGGTFHSVANSLLRRHASAAGLSPTFTILDRTDSEDVINLLRGQLGLSERERRFPRKDTLAEIFSKSANKRCGVEEVVLEEYSHFVKEVPDLQRLFQAYTRYKRQQEMMDYDDLLVRWEALLRQNETVRNQLSQTYRYIMVDEYQDTNRLQAEIVRLLADRHKNVMVVGDDAQSIYSFRGANFQNIMDFPKQFPGTQIFHLEENYRSTQPILNLTNAIINEAKEKYPKHLFTKKREGRPPVVVQAADENEQSRFVSQRVMELQEEGVPLNEIAVLFRSSHHSFDLEIELARHGLPFVKRGGFKFIETAHVKDVVAHLRIVANPRDTVSWNRLLLLVEGIGPKKSQQILARLSASQDIHHTIKELSGQMVGAAHLKELMLLIEEISKERLTPAQRLGRVYEYYTPILQHRYDDHPKRAKDLEHLLTITERYPELDSFLSDMALEPPNESVAGVLASGREDDRLILSTIHSAKGLEWQAVFVIWVLDGKFPTVYSFMKEDELEEERRLLYVAATRAKEHLYLTYPINVYDRSSGMVLSKPSRFLDRISTDLFEVWGTV